MNKKLQSISDLSKRSDMPVIMPGYTVSVHQKIKEGNKERVQIFTGLVIKVSSGRGIDKTFTVRKIVDGIGVERIFPMHSKTIVKVVAVKEANIRRSKLYYIRERSGKSARFKEKYLKNDELVVPEEKISKETEATEESINEAKAKIEAETAKEESNKTAENVEVK